MKEDSARHSWSGMLREWRSRSVDAYADDCSMRALPPWLLLVSLCIGCDDPPSSKSDNQASTLPSTTPATVVRVAEARGCKITGVVTIKDYVGEDVPFTGSSVYLLSEHTTDFATVKDLLERLRVLASLTRLQLVVRQKAAVDLADKATDTDEARAFLKEADRLKFESEKAKLVDEGIVTLLSKIEGADALHVRVLHEAFVTSEAAGVKCGELRKQLAEVLAVARGEVSRNDFTITASAGKYLIYFCPEVAGVTGEWMLPVEVPQGRDALSVVLFPGNAIFLQRSE